jgi:putative ABC transport system ATP-binding protein
LDVRELVYPADGSVLSRVDLAVGEGETVAVLGAHGAGKTALMDCLTGAAHPAAGAVWANGKPFHLMRAEERRACRLRVYGLVHQNASFLPELTIARNCALPLRFAGFEEREAVARARTWLSRFEIADAADQRPTDVAAEQLRRAALARAMVNDPIVVFADEPYAALPEDAADATGRIVCSIARTHGTAVLVFTSDRRTAEQCGRTVHLVSGRTVSGPINASGGAETEDTRPTEPGGQDPLRATR